MKDWLTELGSETWTILMEMAPFLLLGFLLAGLLSVVIKQDLIERWLGKRTLGSVVKASLLGVPLPLCSCGVIPVTSSLYQRGASKGATTSFLTSTPQTGVDSILATAGLIGPLFAGIRVLVALISGIIAGILVDLFEKGPHPEQTSNPEINTRSDQSPIEKLTETLRYGFFTLPQDIGKTLVLGILLAGLLGTLLPENWGESYLSNPWLTYLAVTMVAIPLYVCSTGSIPIAFALLTAGVSPGAALVFLIAGPATNVATITTLLKILGRRTIAIYLVSIVVISWTSGWLLDVYGGAVIAETAAHIHQSTGHSLLQIISGISLLVMVIWAYVYPLFQTHNKSKPMEEMSTLRVEGMTCSHCANHVEQALKKIPGVSAARADAAQNLAWVEGENLNSQVLSNAIKDAGYEFKGLA
ncbi:MAG: permease [Verrucomicrobia bacterium]|nr:permease [Verrucomicrobiota bacterium]